MTGRVVSTKSEKTATVLVTRTAKHPLYKKTFVRSKKYLVQDDLQVKMGDIVEIEKIRPVSKNKHYKVTKVTGRSLEEMVKEHLKEDAVEAISEVMPEEKTKEPAIDSLPAGKASSQIEEKVEEEVKPKKQKSHPKDDQPLAGKGKV